MAWPRNENATEQNTQNSPTLDTTRKKEKRQTTHHLEENSNIRTRRNGLLMGAGTVHFQGQSEMEATC